MISALVAGGLLACTQMGLPAQVGVGDWGRQGRHYWVNLDGMRVSVPPEAVPRGVEAFENARVWAWKLDDSTFVVRCFIPGRIG